MLHQTIKSLRQQKNLSQQELADQLHVVRQTVSKWETGLSVPDAQQLLRLSEILDVSVGDLLGQPQNDSNTETLRLQLEEAEQALQHLHRKRRRNSRIGGAALLIVSLVPLFLTVLPFIRHSFSFPLGTIGGVDGPTSIIVTVSAYRPNWLFPLVWFLIWGGLGVWLICKKKKHAFSKS